MVDITDLESTIAALAGAADTTHLFYAALSQDPDLAVEAERNGQRRSTASSGRRFCPKRLGHNMRHFDKIYNGISHSLR